MEKKVPAKGRWENIFIIPLNEILWNVRLFLFLCPMIDYNLHQHTLFSDGKDLPEKYAEQAIEIGFSAIGFSEHSPLPFANPFSLRAAEAETYIEAIEDLKARFGHKLKIYRSLEMDYIPGMSEDFDFWRKKCQTDYLIGSVHLVSPHGYGELWFTDGPDYKVYDQGVEDYFDGDIRKAVGAFYHQTNSMIETQQFEIIGHFDKITMHNRGRFFSDEDKWYRDFVDETVELIKSKDLIAEVNTRGKYKKRSEGLFPDGYALKRVRELDIPILLSSDAHQPHEINMLFDTTVEYLTTLGFGEVMMLNDGHWKSRPLY
jgi:histidinol-phosphatase (PHP family)